MRQLRDRGKINRTDFYGSPVTYATEKLPGDFNETMRSEKKELWEEAINDEMKSQYENRTWVLVEKPRFEYLRQKLDLKNKKDVKR